MYRKPTATVRHNRLTEYIELPPGDTNFPVQWRLIKTGFSKPSPKTSWRCAVRIGQSKHASWQWRSAQCAALIAPYGLAITLRPIVQPV